jgi:hypothetical protein
VDGQLDLIEFREHFRKGTGLPVEPQMIPKYLGDSQVKRFCSPNGEFAISYSRNELEVCSTTLTVKWMFLAKV